MNGRIIALAIIFGLEAIHYFYYHVLHNYPIDLYRTILTIILFILAWWIGKHCDKTIALKIETKEKNEELVQELQRRKERYTSIVEQSPNFVIIYDNDGNITYSNRKGLALLDAKDSSELVGKNMLEFVKPNFHRTALKRMKKAFNGEVQGSSEYEIQTLKSETKYIESTVIHIKDKYEPAIMVVGFDITSRKKTEKLKQLQEKSYHALLEALPIGIIVHRNRKIIMANSAVEKLVNDGNGDSVVGKSIFDLVPHANRQDIEKNLSLIEQGVAVEPAEFCFMQPDFSKHFVEVSGIQTTFQGDEVILSFAVDITEKKHQLDKINELAFYDTLTSLSNRNLLMDTLEQAIPKAITERSSGYLLFLDLDLFKNINDTYGHSSGDELLIKVANMLNNIPALQNQFISRYGGDEFIIILERVGDISNVAEIAEEIIYTFKKPIFIHDIPMYISTSIGISTFPRDGRDVDTIIKNADIAMYKAKESGRNNYKFYSHHFYENNRRWMEIERELRHAIEREQFSLLYQPKVNLQTNEIIGTEALLRWKHPDLGIISPVEFITIAEENGLIIPIGKWVLETAITQTKEWVNSGWHNVRTAVNVSVLQLKQASFPDELQKLLTAADLDGKHIILEITESLIRDKQSLNILHRLKEMGLQIAMDDFGTGYSSLSILKHVPIDYLKIDKSFIDDIHTQDEVIVRTIIDMGYNLRCKLIAEGVETKEQMEVLQKLNCHLGQGYYFSRPIDAAKVLPLLQSH